MIKHIIMICCYVLCATSALTQIVTVKNQENGTVLQDVAFIKYKPKTFAITNKNGQVDLTAFQGAKEIEVVLTGYKRTVLSFDSIAAMQYTLLLQPLAFSSDEIVVSSTRFAQNAKDLPYRITSMTPKEVQLNNPQTAADLLAGSGEVFVQKSQMGGGSPMIRGFSTNRLLYTVDGVRMNTAIFRSGNLQNVISLDPFAIGHSEILFGPSSVIYGSDAIGGVMSFQTLKPQLALSDTREVSGSATTRMSSANNELSVHFDVNVGWKKWAILTSISSNRFGDLTMGSVGPQDYLRPFYVQRIDGKDVVVTNPDPKLQNPTGYSQINLMQKIRFKPSETWNFEYGFHYSETSDYARYDRHIRTKNDLPRYGEWAYGPQKWMMNLFTISHQSSSNMFEDLSVKIAHQFFEESRISRDFNVDIRETKVEVVNAFSVNIDFEKSIGRRSELFYGVEGVLNDVISTAFDTDISTGINTQGAPRYPKAEWMSYAAYVTNQIKANEKLAFQGGMRYNYYSLDARFNTSFYPFPFATANTNSGALTGSLGSILNVSDKLTMSLNLSTGFRSPNVDDMGKVFDSAPGLVVVPNPDLQAEYAYNADFNIAKIFGARLRVDFTGYYTILRNAMVRRDFTLNGLDSIVYAGEISRVQAIQNAALTTVYGVQAGVDLKLSTGFSIVSKINYQIGTEEMDDGTISPSRHAPPLFGSTKLLYKTGKLSLDFNAIYVADRAYEELPIEEQDKAYLYALDSNGNPYSPAWYTLNFKAMYVINDLLTVNAGLENITDQLYRSYSSGIAGPGRNFILSVKASF
jgi:hemoglobin/transferrin/lactoferrin receptor protein